MCPVEKTRLDSWKAIAEYLGRNARTVTRWASGRGLPVHRVPGGKRSAVFAFKDEIDAWLISHDHSREHTRHGGEAGQNAANSIETSSDFRPAIQVTTNGRSNRFIRLNSSRVFIGIVVVAAVVWILSFSFGRNYTAAAMESMHFVRLTDDGRFKLNLRSHGKTLYFDEFEGQREVLATLPQAGGPVRLIPTPFANVSLEDVSNDGRNILVTSFQGIEDRKPLWTMPVAGGAPKRIGDVFCNCARWSPDNSRIACASGHNLVVLNSDGSASRVLASYGGLPQSLLWSPNGESLRFVVDDPASRRNSSWELEIGTRAEAGPTRAIRLPFGPKCCDNWTWTANASDFVYAKSLDNAGNSVLAVRTESRLEKWLSPQMELPIKIGGIEGLASSAAENGLYLIVSNPIRGELLKFDAEQKSVQVLLPGISGPFLSYSRDGKWVSYVDAADNSLWLAHSDGTGKVRIVGPPMEVELSSWSPDDRQLAFMGKEPGKPWRIFLLNRRNGRIEEASSGEDNQGAPSWSPDGKTLVYANVLCQDFRNCAGVHDLDLATGKTKMLPGSSGLRTARWSPDGKYIAALNPQTREVLLFDIRNQHWKKLANSVAGDDINWSSDSRYVFVDSPRGRKPVIKRIRISNGQRTTVLSLASLQQMPGEMSMWFGLSPDYSVVLFHMYPAAEIYSLAWPSR